MLRSYLLRSFPLRAAWVVALVAVVALFAPVAIEAEAATKSCKPPGTVTGAVYKGATIADVHHTKSSKVYVCTKRRPRPLRVALDDGDTHTILGVAGDFVLYMSRLARPSSIDEVDVSVYLVDTRRRKATYLGDEGPGLERRKTSVDARGTVYVVGAGPTLFRHRGGVSTALDRAPSGPAASSRSWRLRVTRTGGREIVSYAGRRVDATQRAAAILRCFPKGTAEITTQDDVHGITVSATRDVACPFANPRPVTTELGCEEPSVTWRTGWLTSHCRGARTLRVTDLTAGRVTLRAENAGQTAISDFGAVAWTVRPPEATRQARQIMLWTPGSAAPSLVDEADAVASPAWAARTLSWSRRATPTGAFVRRAHTLPAG